MMKILKQLMMQVQNYIVEDFGQNKLMEKDEIHKLLIFIFFFFLNKTFRISQIIICQSSATVTIDTPTHLDIFSI
jgi:hypothetical protein